ncbi:DUF6191 domain-containing protein [Streptomyces sp. NPDC048111]|uniref:DUF6191 domain-containing protein n=1 Tax=Streptomyces sp. NPDC048111 TaxID=3365500 RepID=UPI00371C27A7
MFGGFDEIFAPARRHTEEERRRQEITLDEVGDSDPGRGPIDLAGGSVVIRVPRGGDHTPSPEEHHSDDADPASATALPDSAGADHAAVPDPAQAPLAPAEPGTPDPSSPQHRDA